MHYISIHSLLAEGDTADDYTLVAPGTISIHSLLAEGDGKTRQSFSSSIGEILQTHFFFFVPRILFSSFPSKRLLFPVRTSLAFYVRFLFAPARHTISTSSG